ncbi:MAG: hypothetical protein ACRC62_15115 [Microcoleus sp.]
MAKTHIGRKIGEYSLSTLLGQQVTAYILRQVLSWQIKPLNSSHGAVETFVSRTGVTTSQTTILRTFNAGTPSPDAAKRKDTVIIARPEIIEGFVYTYSEAVEVSRLWHGRTYTEKIAPMGYTLYDMLMIPALALRWKNIERIENLLPDSFVHADRARAIRGVLTLDFVKAATKQGVDQELLARAAIAAACQICQPNAIETLEQLKTLAQYQVDFPTEKSTPCGSVGLIVYGVLRSVKKTEEEFAKESGLSVDDVHAFIFTNKQFSLDKVKKLAHAIARASSKYSVDRFMELSQYRIKIKR